MKNQKTVFVLGAGASYELGLPTGAELIKIIANRLSYKVENGVLIDSLGDHDIIDIFQSIVKTKPEINEYLRAAAQIKEGVIHSKSIDSFLDLHRESSHISLCGKLAIVRSILEAERKSHIFTERDSISFQRQEAVMECWLPEFFKNLCDGVRKNEINRIFDKVSFVVFNYDRCLEHFLYIALQKLYGIDGKSAAEIMNHLEIVHPYGALAPLPWMGNDGITFGANSSRVNLQFMAQNIRTYTEEIQKKETTDAINSLFKAADTVVFLGFSYHPQNMKIISGGLGFDIKKVFGTTHGISFDDRDKIKQEIYSALKRRKISDDFDNLVGMRDCIFFDDYKCLKLLTQYSRSLFIAGPNR